MIRRTLAALVAALTLAVLASAPASADMANCSHAMESRYSALYHKTADVMGKRAPGRNIRKLGLRGGSRASCNDLGRSIRTFRRWHAPPAPPAAPGDRAPTGRTASIPRLAGGAYSIPRQIVMCESGGNYRAVNPSSGAGGAYQVLPSTWQAMGGTGRPQDASPAEQDRIAAKIWRVQGRGAWVC